jgi:hypothetical protein
MSTPAKASMTVIWCGLVSLWPLLPTISAQQTEKRVSLIMEVADNQGRYVNGLRSDDFRLIEDGVVQKISRFAEKHDTYVVSYIPKQNPNQGFRRVHVRIVSDHGVYLVRHISGYRPEQRR